MNPLTTTPFEARSVETRSINADIDPLKALILALKSHELFLEANAKSDVNIAKQYMSFLLDLHRYEEAYEKAKEIAQFIPDYKHALAFFAIYLNDENLVREHVSQFTLSPGARDDEWLSLIAYHHVRGTIDELLCTHPLPLSRHLKTLMYYFANDYVAIINLLDKRNNLSEIEEWFLFISCCRLPHQTLKASCLNRILENGVPLPPAYFREAALECLGPEMQGLRREEVLEYLEKHLKKNPNCIATARAIVNFSRDHHLMHEMGERLKRLLIAFPSKTNKFHLVFYGSGDEKVKIEGLFKKFMSNGFSHELINALYDSEYLESDKKLELLNTAISRSNSLVYEIYRVDCLIHNIENKFNEEEVNSILRKIELLLLRAPHHRVLLLRKATLLALLKNGADSKKIFGDYIRLFGITMQLVMVIDTISDLLDKEFVIGFLREAHKQIDNKKTRDALIRAFNNHRAGLEGIQFIISTRSIGEEDQKIDFDFITMLIDDAIKEEAYSLIDTVQRGKESLPFIVKRAEFYANKADKRALNDIEFISRFNPVEAKALKFDYLLSSKMTVEAVHEMLASKMDIPNETFEKIVKDLFDLGEYKLIAEAQKAYKPVLSYDGNGYLAVAYYQLKRYHEALPLFKIQINEDPYDDSAYYYRACCFENLNQIGNAIDTLNDGLENLPEDGLLLSYKKELQEKLNAPQTHAVKSEGVKGLIKAKPLAIDPKKVPHFIEEPSKKTGKKPSQSDGPRLEKVKKVLQNAPAHAVDPLADPLADIKALAKKGEKETGPKEKPAPAPAPIAAPIKGEAPKPIVKLSLRPREKVFLKKAHTALSEYNAMKTPLLSQEIVFRNQIYTILRVFTPLRLNAKHTQLVKDLVRIRDHARHDIDQISQERLDSLFSYLKSIHLENQLLDWIREKSIINRLMLQNHHITVRKPKKTPHERVIQELEFIIKNRGDKETWNDRLYHRNAIKASLSIIGEASNFLAEDLKALFAEYRIAGNDLAHEFFVDGETLENVERLKEEDITPGELWVLAQNAETLLGSLKK